MQLCTTLQHIPRNVRVLYVRQMHTSCSTENTGRSHRTYGSEPAGTAAERVRAQFWQVSPCMHDASREQVGMQTCGERECVSLQSRAVDYEVKRGTAVKWPCQEECCAHISSPLPTREAHVGAAPPPPVLLNNLAFSQSLSLSPQASPAQES